MRKVICRLYSGLQEIKVATIIYVKPGKQTAAFQKISDIELFGWKCLVGYFIRLSIPATQVVPAVGGCVFLGKRSISLKLPIVLSLRINGLSTYYIALS